MKPSQISVVIPTLNEESVVADAVRSAIEAGATEVIVSDGGSRDQTIPNATAAGASKIIRSLPGRGIQLNAGAVFASHEVVLFLHADCRLSEASLLQICESSEVVWGAFVQQIEAKGLGYRLLEKGNAMRVKYRWLPFGDQAIFVRRATYKEQGGFEEISLMEDLAFSKWMRKIAKPVLLPGPVSMSPRHWEKRGIVRQTAFNLWLQLSYACGVSPDRLAKRYR
ncbi:Glycosyl transferase family 2 [Novipirellula aureliae]|uniref:Glycosyl transferase family 2 n=1 Tax=Novipirellula aureliae TaxID=2527966 RepID=A0A5C6E2Z3_9BACT|nr:TIGR04283 family arsenosugar biosynthesis glycosyltransferase [Novipirellula aureliae]TWU43228.1 Glycosyl transferase family 2 [Novipirellula aureliae]